MSTILQAPRISDFAIIVDRKDNVAVVKNETAAGLEVVLPDGRLMTVKAVVPPGHRFATSIPTAIVLQYGHP